MKIQEISSRDNPVVKAIKKLAQSNTGYKESNQIWLEGEHLCEAFLLAKNAHKTELSLKMAVLGSSVVQKWRERLVDSEIIVLPDALLSQISGLSSSGGLGFIVSLPNDQSGSLKKTTQKKVHTAILDSIQDAGNVGSILRSAASFGVQQVIALHGTAALWSSKVLRAGMGAHFALHLVEGLVAADVQIDMPILATHVHNGEFLHTLQAEERLPYPCAWVMGHEGRGVSKALLDRATQLVRIKQSGQESLNVAAAAAVCLYASMPSIN